MTAKGSLLNARVDSQVKDEAERVFAHLGITTTDAIRLLLGLIIERRGIPFPLLVEEKPRECLSGKPQARRNKLTDDKPPSAQEC